MKRFLQQIPLFLFMLPLFFVLHGMLENFGYINVFECLLLIITYGGAAAFLYFIFSFFYRNYTKASLLASYLVAFYLFFGAIHEFLKHLSSFIYKYSVLLPLFLASAIALFFYLKKTKKQFYGTTLFINLLLLIYLGVDTFLIIAKAIHPATDRLSVYSFAKDSQYKPCDSCSKPDIYFLLFDEYASSYSLMQQHHYNNSSFDSFLVQRGFHIQPLSHSNYNFTPFSMSSILNMSYLNGIRDHSAITADDYAYCNKLIRDNEAIKLLSHEGYDIINYSVFDLAGNPARVEQNFLPLKTKLITDRTLFSQLRKDVGWMLYTGKIKIKWFTENSMFRHMENNNRFVSLVEKESLTVAKKPRFVYAHFYMPHPPYFFDKDMNPKSESTVYKEYKETSVQGYLDYLPYTNSRVKEVISSIQRNTQNKAVIIFMGDHGFRYKTDLENPAFNFQNQNAIFFPDRDYHLLYDSISGVNQFRVIFDKLFNLGIPLLADTSIYLRDKK